MNIQAGVHTSQSRIISQACPEDPLWAYTREQNSRVTEVRDGFADRRVVQFLRFIELVPSGFPAVWKCPMYLKLSLIVRMMSPSMICMW